MSWKTLEEDEAAAIIIQARREQSTVSEVCRRIAVERGYSEAELDCLVSDVEILEVLWSLEASGEAVRTPDGWIKGRGKGRLH